ncbi:Uncharacterised protein [Candidatus Ornithobacterium hominis]|uniref:DUF4837 family protein n=1 Tax=Candidatus Ornithobacterium hominis TaxID=2497989 RepID=UPI000E5AE11C|nr:DUF4837 family protein [Candidatus Ornithobacterium hominis]SZD71816.1 Uncharacterised protein [Candidatus Ornithobacterium hominis]
MHLFNKLSFIFFAALLIYGCKKKSNQEQESSYRPDSSGPINLVSVFSDPLLYDKLEPGLNDTLLFGKVFPGLYYPPEVMFATRPFSMGVFDNFKRTRLVLKIEKGAPKIELSKDKYAKPQGFVNVSGESNEQILELLYQNQDSILDLYRWADRTFLLQGFKEKSKSTPQLEKLGINLLIPNDFKLAEENKNFVWFRKDEVNTVHNRTANNNIVNHSSNDILNILVYKVPFKKSDLELLDLIKIRDSVNAKYTKGAREPEYQYIGVDSIKLLVSDFIQTEPEPVLRDFFDFKLIQNQNKQKTYESQGWWSMSLSQMGGPYTTKVILDTENQELYIADAILFAPLNQGKSKKRDYLTQMEGLFTTFKILK